MEQVWFICTAHRAQKDLGTYTREILRHEVGKIGWLRKEKLDVRLCASSNLADSAEMLCY